jgi:hypothetical protein
LILCFERLINELDEELGVRVGFWSFLAKLAPLALVASPANAESLADPKIVTDAKTAADWAANALTVSGYNADFSMESLKNVEQFFLDEAPDRKAKPNGAFSENRGSVLFSVGAYVGETIRRAGNGEWIGDDTDPAAEINISIKLEDGTVFWPVQRVMKRFQNGPEDNVEHYGLAILKKTEL